MVEVLDHAPAALTPRERWALVVLAEDANDVTRVCSKGVESNEKVMRRFRAGLSGRKEIIKALIDNGALARVKRGQKHQHAEFMILPLAPQQPETPDPENGLSSRESWPLSDAQQPDSPVSGAGFSGLSSRKTQPPSPQSPQDSSSPRARAVQVVTARTGATKEEAEEIIRIIESKHTIKSSLLGFLRSMADHGDLDTELVALRRRNGRADIAAWLDQLKTLPPCEHGLPGGDQRRPDTGKPQCPQCRGPHGHRPAPPTDRGLEAWT